MRILRLEAPLLSLQKRGDGSRALSMLPRGADLIAASEPDGNFVDVVYDGAPFLVFAADLAERSVQAGGDC